MCTIIKVVILYPVNPLRNFASKLQRDLTSRNFLSPARQTAKSKTTLLQKCRHKTTNRQKCRSEMDTLSGVLPERRMGDLEERCCKLSVCEASRGKSGVKNDRGILGWCVDESTYPLWQKDREFSGKTNPLTQI